jgi:hypothetical protein
MYETGKSENQKSEEAPADSAKAGEQGPVDAEFKEVPKQ